jgi:hypothetical protein
MAAVIDVNRGTVTGRHVFTRTLSEATEDSSPDARAAWSRLRRNTEDSVSLAIDAEGMWFTEGKDHGSMPRSLHFSPRRPA